MKQVWPNRPCRSLRSSAFVLATSALLTACAHYTPSPLATPAAALAPPDPMALAAAGAIVERPFLKPQPIDLEQPLTLDALAVITVIENPDLKALRAKTGITDAQAFAARLLPDPTAQLGFDKRLSGPDPFNGLAAQIGIDLNQLRMARVTREAAAANRRQVRFDLAWAEWQAAGQARLLGVRVVALGAESVLANASATLAAGQLDAVLRAAGRGDVAGAELDARRQAALDAADKARTAERDLIAARGDLNKQLGLPPGIAIRIAAIAPPAPLPSAAALVGLAIDRRLDLQALRAGYASAEAETHRAILEQFPTLSLTMASARDTANNHTIGPQVGFTLPLWNRNRGGIAVATATREQLKTEYAARLFQTRADIADAVANIDAANRQRTALAAQLPASRRFAEAMMRASLRGDLARSVGDAAAQAVRDRELALLVLDQQAAEQMVALELLSGSLHEGWSR